MCSPHFNSSITLILALLKNPEFRLQWVQWNLKYLPHHTTTQQLESCRDSQFLIQRH